MKHFGEASARMWRLRNHVHNQPYRICTERAKIVTESYKRNAAQHNITKRAMMLRDILLGMEITLEEDDLLMGYQSPLLHAAPIFPEYSFGWLIEELDELALRPGDAFYPTEEQKQELRDMAAFWEHNTLEARALSIMDERALRFNDMDVVRAYNTMTCGDGHIAINFDKLLAVGLAGYKKEARDILATLDVTRYEDIRKKVFLEAVVLVLDGAVAFAHRNADYAEAQAGKTEDPARKQELLRLAEICRRVPEHPPENYYEAVQCVWFMMLILQLESNGHSVSLGRVDQYLNAYYTKDLASGTITETAACELMENLCIKLYSVNKIRPWKYSKFSAGAPMYENITVGGQTKDGRDATNEMTYLILKAVSHMHLTQPNLVVRYHAGMPQELLMECAELIKEGFGMPAFLGDEIIILSLMELGISKEDAYDYTAIGCIEVAVAGRWIYRCTGMSFLNFGKILELALNGGAERRTGEKLVEGIPLLREMSTFEEVFEAWRTACIDATRQSIVLDSIIDVAIEDMVPDVFCSALTDDCIARGKPLKEGGAVYDFVSGLQVGIANIGNSLAAVKKLVFDEGAITMEQLSDALDQDFEGFENERIRNMLIHRAPKYGCDDDYVDQLVVDCYNVYINELPKYKNTRFGRGPIGGTYYAGTSSISANVPNGAVVWATPDGRKAWEPLAEGCSPMSGTDIFGPTAVMKSVTKLPTAKIMGGVLLNQKILPSSVVTPEDSEKLGFMIRTFFDTLDGYHIQYNYVEHQTLLDAQQHPDKHRDLIVRVAGYSAFFTVLSEQTQNDIIARTAHAL